MENRELVSESQVLQDRFFTILEERCGFKRDRAFKVPFGSEGMVGKKVEIGVEQTEEGIIARVYIPADLAEHPEFTKQTADMPRYSADSKKPLSNAQIPYSVSAPILIRHEHEMEIGIFKAVKLAQLAAKLLKDSGTKTHVDKWAPIEKDGQTQWMLAEPAYMQIGIAVGSWGGALTGAAIGAQRVDSCVDFIQQHAGILPDLITNFTHEAAMTEAGGTGEDLVVGRTLAAIFLAVAGGVSGTIGGAIAKRIRELRRPKY